MIQRSEITGTLARQPGQGRKVTSQQQVEEVATTIVEQEMENVQPAHQLPAAFGQYLGRRISHIQRQGRSCIRCYSFIRTNSLLCKNCSQTMWPPNWTLH